MGMLQAFTVKVGKKIAAANLSTFQLDRHAKRA
jgi:hypothetical protein